MLAGVMRALLGLLALLGGAMLGCGGPCAESADVQLTIEGDAAALASATQLEIGTRVGTRERMLFRLVFDGALEPGRTVLLHPTATPAGDVYELTVDVTAQRADGSALATGTTAASFSTSGCNHATVALK